MNHAAQLAPAGKRRLLIEACLIGTLALLVAACGGSTETPPGTSPTGPGLQAEIVASELLPGVQRFPVGILDANTPVSDAVVHVRAFLVAGNTLQLKDESDAPFRGAGLEGRGLYVAHLRFDTAGTWGAEITAQRPNGAHKVIRLPFKVTDKPMVPAPGQPAPRSHNPTARDVPDVSYIDSGQPPDDMHQLSIADAIAQHRPTLVVFATPAFCVSQTCGPQVHAVQQLEPLYRNGLTFIHVEVYQDFKPDPSKRRLTDTFVQWRFQTEPWVFLIDSKGVIRDRFEATADTTELSAAIEQLLASP